MEQGSREHVTQLLAATAAGGEDAANELLTIMYDELRIIARRQMAKVASDSLPPTALVHEAYIRMVGNEAPEWKDHRHFFAIAARAMRAVIVDQARMRNSIKRGGNRRRLPLNQQTVIARADTEDVLSLDAALDSLQAVNKTGADVVMLRFFAGLTIDEIAAALGLSTSTVDRHWAFSKAWLRRELDASRE